MADNKEDTRAKSEEPEVTKIQRGNKKGVVTRYAKNLVRYVVEEDIEAVKATIDKMRNAFKEFESFHERYHISLDDPKEIEASDEYFYQAEQEYVESLKDAKDWVNGYNRLNGPQTQDRDRYSHVVSDVYSMVNLPKVELEPFDGNLLTYHNFIATFSEVVDKVVKDDRIKLTRLLQSTTGKAKEAIKSCILIPGDAGYHQACKILRQRFGNEHLITEHTIQSLRQEKPIRSTEDLLRLADELVNCEMTLKQMDRLAEIDSQSCILEVVKRLQLHHQSRWKRQALEMKREYDRYPRFTDFVKFISKEAEEAADPVYGKIGQRTCADFKSRSPSGSTQVKSMSFASNVSHQFVQRTYPPCMLCSGGHKLLFCAKFKDMKVDEAEICQR